MMFGRGSLFEWIGLSEKLPPYVKLKFPPKGLNGSSAFDSKTLYRESASKTSLQTRAILRDYGLGQFI